MLTGVRAPTLEEHTGDEEALKRIVELVSARTGVDLRSYRRSTVLRRTTTRMKKLACNDYSAYLGFLTGSPNEAQALLEHITIKYSRFFRDQPLFDRLRDEIIPKLMATTARRLRVWSAGCGRGEETYSLALLIRALANGASSRATLYGTDIDESALEGARSCEYTPSALSNIPTPMRDTYFTVISGRRGQEYKVRQDLGMDVRFLRHDLLNDPPLPSAPFDLIVCRNVLIYFEAKAQIRVFDLLAASIVTGGYLCLGEAERLPSTHSSLFATVDARNRIYRRE